MVKNHKMLWLLAAIEVAVLVFKYLKDQLGGIIAASVMAGR